MDLPLEIQDSEWITPLEFSRRENVTLRTVHSRMEKKKYRPYMRKVDGKWIIHASAFKKLVNKKMQKIHQDRFTPEYIKNSPRANPEKNSAPQFPPGREIKDYLEEKRKWSARFEELRYRKHLKEVVSSKAVAHEAGTVARLARDQLLQIADRISGQLINVGSYDQIFAVINGEVNRVLIELTKAVEKISVDDTISLDSDPDSQSNIQTIDPEPEVRAAKGVAKADIDEPFDPDDDDGDDPYEYDDDEDDEDVDFEHLDGDSLDDPEYVEEF